MFWNLILEFCLIWWFGDIVFCFVLRVCLDFFWFNVFCMYCWWFDYEFLFRLLVFFNDWRSRNFKSLCIIFILLIKSLFVFRLWYIYMLLYLILNKWLWDLKMIEGKRRFLRESYNVYVNINECIWSVYV